MFHKTLHYKGRKSSKIRLDVVDQKIVQIPIEAEFEEYSHIVFPNEYEQSAIAHERIEGEYMHYITDFESNKNR